MERITDGSQLDLCNILQAKDGTICIGTNDNVFEFGDFLQTTFVLQRVLVAVLNTIAMGTVYGLLA